MFSAPLGRLRFFFYSFAVVVAEAIAVIICIALTMGGEAFVNSQPGPSRQSLAAACLIVLLVFAALRANLAWRRGDDASLSKWILAPYIIFTVLFAVLQAATILMHKFGAENSNTGLGLMSLCLMGIWCAICFAKPKTRLFDPDSFLRKEGHVVGPWDVERPPAASAEPEARRWPTPPITLPQGPRSPGTVSFGKRGLT